MTDYGSSTPLSVDSKPHELHRIEEHQHDCDLCATAAPRLAEGMALRCSGDSEETVHTLQSEADGVKATEEQEER